MPNVTSVSSRTVTGERLVIAFSFEVALVSESGADATIRPPLSSDKRPVIRTAPQPRPTVLYDGHCRFCTHQVRNLERLAGKGHFEKVSFQEPGVLEGFPGLTHEQCMRAMQLVLADGRVYTGMAAAARAVTLRGWTGSFAWLYYVPVLKQILDGIYWIIARNRYRLGGKQACDSDACAVHFKR
jgi:predicted DCC family thiol-disulfide oxidoreductase YuxK